MPLVNVPAAALVFLGLVALPAAALASEWVPGTQATLTLTDSGGHPVEAVVPGRVFGLRLALSDAASGKPYLPPEGVYAWLRKVKRGNLSCADATDNFLKTRNLPKDAIDLNGVAIIDVTDDGSVHISDPKLDLATSNMLAAHRLDSAPGGVLVHDGRRSLLVSVPVRQEVLEFPASGEAPTVIAKGLNGPGALVPGPGRSFYVAEDRGGAVSSIGPDGGRGESIAIGRGPLTLSGDGRYLAAVAADGAAKVIDMDTGRPVLSLPASSATVAAAAWGDGLSSLAVTIDRGGDTVFLRYLDAPAEAVRIPVATMVKRLAISPDGRHVLAFSPNSNGLSIVSLAAGRLAQALALPAPVAEVAFLGKVALIRLADASAIVSFDLATAEPGMNASVGKVPLGAPSTKAADSRLLFALSPTPRAIAVHPDTFSAIVLESKMAAADSLPQTGFRLRGGVPVFVGAVDRSFRQTSPGGYETAASIDRPGMYELMVTTGIAQMRACFQIRVEGEDTGPGSVAVKLVTDNATDAVAGQDTPFRFSIEDENGQAVAPALAGLRVQSLDIGWRADFPVKGQDTQFSAVIKLPLPGLYSVQPIGLPSQYEIVRSAQIEVQP
jgi:hypothetical protein